jgi:hypothetical protein
MDKAEFLHKRKRRYMAQTLEGFEEIIEPHLSTAAAGDIQSFKGLVRARLDALTNDACDLFALGDGELNGVAVEVKDKLSPVGRP